MKKKAAALKARRRGPGVQETLGNPRHLSWPGPGTVLLAYPSDVDALDTRQLRENTSPWDCASDEKMSFGEQEVLRGGHGDPGGVEMMLRLSFSLESPGGAFSTLTPRRDPSPVQSGPLVRGHRVSG